MENKLVEIQNNQVVVSSRQIAEHFEKRHADVLASIEKLKTENSVLINMFCEHSYKVDGNNKTYPEYLMNRDGFSLLVMGFTGKKALEWKIKYINAFNEMEKKLLPSYAIEDPIKRAEKWIEEYKERQNLLNENKQLNEALKEAQPKADYTDLVLQSNRVISITVIAKDYDMSARKMNELLKKHSIQYYVDGTWVLYAKHQGNGYTKTVTVPYNDGKNSAVHMKWTQKGRLFLYHELKNIGVLPTIEK
jgi:Rha family phage regulatory protein|nr:MAG TPA: hypothetical protein [Caudoviricetes sp.]